MRAQRHVLALGVVLAALSACSSHANVAEHANRALSTALAAVNATQTAFVSWDAEEQSRIVAAATTEHEGELALLAHRVKRRKVTQAFVASYAALTVAAGTLVLFEGGGDPADLLLRLRAVGSAVLELRAAVAAIQVP